MKKKTNVSKNNSISKKFVFEKYRFATKEGLKIKKLYSSLLSRNIVIVEDSGFYKILFDYDPETGIGSVLYDKQMSDCVRYFDSVSSAYQYLEENVFHFGDLDFVSLCVKDKSNLNSVEVKNGD